MPHNDREECARERGRLRDCSKLWVSKTCCKCSCKCKQSLCFHLLCAFIMLPLVPASRGVWLISFHYAIAYATSMARPQLCVCGFCSPVQPWKMICFCFVSIYLWHNQNPKLLHTPPHTHIIYDSQPFLPFPHSPAMTCPRSVKQLN